MQRVELPDSGWAELRDADDLTLGDIIEIKNAVRVAVASRAGQNGQRDDETRIEVGTGQGEELEAAILAKVVTSWTLPQPPSRQAVRGLTVKQLRPFRKVIDPYVRVVRGEDDEDPNSLTGGRTATG